MGGEPGPLSRVRRRMRTFFGAAGNEVAANRAALELTRGLRGRSTLEEGETLLQRLTSFLAASLRLDRAPATAAVRDSFADLLETLRPHYASALRSVELEGRKVRDFADEAGITVSNGGVRLFRARAGLRRRLREALAFCPRHESHLCECDPQTLDAV